VTLLSAITLGALDLPNAIIMAPLTRGRATVAGIPTPRMATYYAARAQAGLIISEATAISAQGYGWLNAPALYTDAQQAGWQPVVAAVHAAGGRMFCQLWHMGRISHPDFLGGELPFAPSAIASEGEGHTPQGKKPFVTPKAMTQADIDTTISEYVHAAERAKAAGFDGIEIHAANGYLLDEFLRDGSNHRTDAYGGSAENRCRLLMQVLAAVIPVMGADRVGVRISPLSPRHSMADSQPEQTFTTLAELLSPLGLAYLHVVETPPGHMLSPKGQTTTITPVIRAAYAGKLIACGAYTQRRATEALNNGLADAIAFGIPFIANPDLVERFKQNAPLNKADISTFYTDTPCIDWTTEGWDKGYLDYPVLATAAI
jgi:N-ethylmaleimide reductase